MFLCSIGGKIWKFSIAETFGMEEVLETQFHHAKENRSFNALIHLGRRKSQSMMK